MYLGACALLTDGGTWMAAAPIRVPYQLAISAAVSRPPEFLRDLLDASVVTGEGANKTLEISASNLRRLEAEYGTLATPATMGGAAEPVASTGPGSQLKKLLSLIGITSSPTCSCNARAKQMDEWGPDECENRMEEIVTWLGEEAKRRNLPFFRLAGEQIVKLAIRRARKAASGTHD